MIKFLGTAGARHVVSRQLRSSAGVYIRGGGKNLLLDPGPGTLVKLASSRPKIDVSAVDGIILSHVHIDHSGDANVIIDAMTGGGFKKRGVLFAPVEALEGDRAVILKYLRGFLEDIVVLEPEKEYGLGGLRFSTSCAHMHPVETYGLKFRLGGKNVSFITDTMFSPVIAGNYAGSDVLVVNTVRNCPHGSMKIMHLSAEDLKLLAGEIRPEKLYLTHFGLTMLKAGPRRVAERLSAELGVEVVAATDGMTLDL